MQANAMAARVEEERGDEAGHGGDTGKRKAGTSSGDLPAAGKKGKRVAPVEGGREQEAGGRAVPEPVKEPVKLTGRYLRTTKPYIWDKA